MRKDLIITIDGPSGAGKSTVARRLAERIGYTYIDTGAMYRALAFASYKYGKDVEEIMHKVELKFEFGKETRVFLDGEEISAAIRLPEISLLASNISKRGNVRKFLTDMQRRMAINGGIVIEGRDTGSVVFPDAHLKFYLDAEIGERARRRYSELREKGEDVEYERLKDETIIRDREDSSREIAPLIIPSDAIYLDTTNMTVEDVVESILKFIEDRINAGH